MRTSLIAAAALSASGLAGCMTEDASPPPPAVGIATGAPTAIDYVPEAGRSDLYEIQSSQLALERSSTAAVRDMANTMIRDHTNSTQMVMAAARQAGLPAPPPPVLDVRRQVMVDQLRAASPAEFDRLYLHQQLMAHQEALALHTSYARAGDQAPLRAAANQIAPIVQRHLSMLQAMGPT